MKKYLSLFLILCFFITSVTPPEAMAKRKKKRRSKRYVPVTSYQSDGRAYTNSINTSTKFDIPFTHNRHVQKWVDYFTGKGRRHFNRYLARLGRMMPYVHSVARQYGVPKDLVYLSMIESGFNLRAKSWASAVGPWQFIRSTGAIYGLNVDYWIDERRDPEKATHAALRHLRDLHNEFNDWYLAFAAYNAGSGKVRRAIRMYGRNFWGMLRGRYLKPETKNYVPKILAAALVAKNAEKYGFRNVRYQKPISFERVRLKGPTELDVAANCAGVEGDLIRLLNPELLRNMTPPHIPGYQLKIPRGTGDRFRRSYAALRPSQRVRMVEHRVRKGETHRSIARHYGVSEKDLAEANPGDIKVTKYKKRKRVKVWLKKRRGRKRRFRWRRKTVIVRNYQVSPGKTLTIPKNRSLANYDSMRDDQAAYRAAARFGSARFAGLDDSRKKLSKKDRRRLKREQKRLAKEKKRLAKLEKRRRKKAGHQKKFRASSTTNFASNSPNQNFYQKGQSTKPTQETLRNAVAQMHHRHPDEPPLESDITLEGDPLAKDNRWVEANTKNETLRDVKTKPKTIQKKKYHKVRRGETLSKIARRYGVSQRQLRAWNGRKVHPKLIAGKRILVASKPSPSKTPSLISSAHASSAPFKTSTQTKSHSAFYRVKPGDTLSQVAIKHGVKVAQLKSWNGKKTHPVLRSGVKIRVKAPPPKIVKYKVRPGDNLNKIAKKHSITVAQLRRLNRKKIKGDRIRAGDVLIVSN